LPISGTALWQVPGANGSVNIAFETMFGGFLIVSLVFGAIFAFGWAATKLGF
jgi:hypothetical protein